MRGGALRRAASLLLTLAVGAFFVRKAASRFTRYAIAGESMLPALRPGDFVVVDRHAYATWAPAPGDIVLAPDPREPSRQLVKRVLECDVVRGAWLEGDNPALSTDSRHFGSIPAEGLLGRVRWRYWPPGRAGNVR